MLFVRKYTGQTVFDLANDSATKQVLEGSLSRVSSQLLTSSFPFGL